MRGHGTIALPELQGSRVAAAGFDWMYRFIQPPPEPPPFGISAVRIGESLVPVVEAVVDSTQFRARRKFTRAAATTASGRMRSGPASPEIFLCAPLAGHHAVMLRETVETLLQ